MKKDNKIKPQQEKIETEYLSKDILEEDFINEFSSFLSLQMLLGISHVEARDRFVTAPSVWQKLYSIFMLITSLSLYILCSYYYVDDYQYTHMTILMSINFIILAVFNILVYLNSRFFYNDENVKLYVQMQKIDRIMRIEHNNVIYRMMRWFNLPTVTVILGGFFILFIGACVGEEAIMYLGYFIPFATCGLEVGYGSNLIMHFFIRVRFINAILENYIEGKELLKWPKHCAGSGPSKMTLRCLAAESHEYETSDTDVYLNEILDCYQKFQVLYRLPIGFCIAHIFIYILVACQFLYFSLTRNKLLTRDFVGVLSNIIFGLMHTIFLCLRSDFFVREVKQIKSYVVTIMSDNTEGPLRDKAKRMLQLVDQMPVQFSIYDMWVVDNGLLVNFLKHVNGILFTVLQLNFLR